VEEWTTFLADLAKNVNKESGVKEEDIEVPAAVLVTMIGKKEAKEVSDREDSKEIKASIREDSKEDKDKEDMVAKASEPARVLTKEVKASIKEATVVKANGDDL